MKKWISTSWMGRASLGGTCLAVILVCCAFPGCGQSPEKVPPSSEDSRGRPVQCTVVPAPEALSGTFYPGRVQAAEQIRLSFEHSGTIRDITVQMGDFVRSGQVAARLDPKEYRLALAAKKADVREVRAGLREAAADYERVKALYEMQNVSQRDLDQAQARRSSLQAKLDAARQAVQLARKRFRDCTLRAPVAGRVAAVPVEAHQTIQAGHPVLVLDAKRPAEVRIGVPEPLISKVRPGMEARVRLQALPGKGFLARVSEIGVESTSLGTFPVTLTLEKKAQGIRAGMAAEAALNLARERKKIFVPAQAVAGDPGGDRFVWIVDIDSSQVHKRNVQVGPLTAKGVEIASGLFGGERIVVRGVHRLNAGMKVRVLNESGSPVSGQ